jgi:hypothetical protein
MPETNLLGRLAWDLHKTFALENNSEVRYGFSPLVAYNITVTEESIGLWQTVVRM